MNENEQPQDDSNVPSKKRDEPAAEPKEAGAVLVFVLIVKDKTYVFSN